MDEFLDAFKPDAPLDEGELPEFRNKRGTVMHNLLGQIILDRNHARHIGGALAVWTGSRWDMGERAVSRIVLEYADDALKNVRREVYSYLDVKAPFVTPEECFDGRYYIQFRNGTYDVLAGAMVKPTPDMFVMNTLPVSLDLNAPPGYADHFIESLANGDGPTAKVMREIVGACMCCKPIIQQSPMLVGRANGRRGTASNGKSTYIRTLGALLGPENYSSLDIATLGQRFQTLYTMGKLANLGDDIPDGMLRGKDLSMFKKLVTGERLFSDVKGSEGVQYSSYATLIFSMNKVPRLAETTEGVYRRLAFVPFRSVFTPGSPGYDPHVSERMAQHENLQRLALLGIMELPDLIARGKLTEIPDMLDELEAVRSDNDVVLRWIEDEGITEDNLLGKGVSNVYASFDRWCDLMGERDKCSQPKLTRRLQELFDIEKSANAQHTASGRRERVFVRAASK